MYQMAQIYGNDLGKINDALTVYQQIVFLFPEDGRAPKAMIEMGQLYEKNEDWKQAIEIYQRFQDKFPDHKINDDVIFRMAEIYYFQLKNESQAKQLYQTILQNYPKSSWVSFAKQRIEKLNKGDNHHGK